MSKTADDTGTSRRDFLKIATAAAPAAAAVAVMAPDSAEAQPADLSSTKMQDTAHTRAYLDSARF
ncbi:MAG: ubiquinol-cytochrome c reductase iron-sulfur subunit N-terminal domain-containing protein [Shimia sp.]|jgi:Rieske Fe-S protein|uniref:ubiquinol-cytochrome c reductase iron-sulfur subunit N-terminal domain-containing protein n=1 Tax=unclassified Shimia TaxID=2630038 RepID=UPI0006B5DEB2|nr:MULTISPECIES: ubiquinol-cytochrome c reductase iron-sulfur subunit N-terminal domain-containing protein [unclassified Shimia]KPA19946.1 Ubiquitinol-cytochrome C reductase Fe-S subunit TAT signal [Shimia sp. SK013]